MNPSNDNSSPLHLSSVLNNLSLDVNTSQQEILPTTYSLRLANLPNDISLREAYAVFALAAGTLNVELIDDNSYNNEESVNESIIVATFDSLDLIVRYAQILSSKADIFGPSNPVSCNVEIVDNSTQNQVPFQRVNSSQFNGQVPSYLNSGQGNQLPLGNNGSANLVTPRSKFTFSDPFANNNMASTNDTLQQNQPQPSTVNQSHQDLSVNTTDIGKSFLLMDNDEINDTIWGPNTIPSSINGLSSTPQPSTPTLEWGNNNPRKQSSVFFMLPNSSSVATPTIPQNMDVMSMSKGMQNPSSMPPNSSASSVQPYGLMNQMGSNMPQHNMGGNMIDNDEMNFSNAQKQQNNFNNNSPYKSRMNPTSTRNPVNTATGTTTTAGKLTDASNTNVSNNSTSNLTKIGSATPLSKTVNPQATISQADLSLLARVPPPANPADQNPPCNTLYVGNLPPDATEQELRQLFAGQQGFRRLSFRNKNNNGNGHGPMCFVEFDDVSFATRALAELYGSQLPRTTTSNKGGIRLSFSKNPLGVRGPNSRRNVPASGTSNGSTSSNATSTPNSGIMSMSNAPSVNTGNMPYTYTNNYTKN